MKYPRFIYSWFNYPVSTQPNHLLPMSPCPCWTAHVDKPKGKKISARILAGSLSLVSLRFALKCRSSTEYIILLLKISLMYNRAWNVYQTACSNNTSPNRIQIFLAKQVRKKYFGNILHAHLVPNLFGSVKGVPSLRRSLSRLFFYFLVLWHNCAKRLITYSCLSVCPSLWNNSPHTRRIFMEYDIFRKSAKKLKFL